MSVPDGGGRQSPVRFAGYAAIFDRVDRGGDVIRPGAFARSLAEQARVPLYWQHDGRYCVGSITTLAEDERGLRVIAGVDGAAGHAVAARQIAGLSFGYRIREARNTARGRELIDLDLIEVSLVSQPMQPLARIHAIEADAAAAAAAAVHPFAPPNVHRSTATP